MKSTACRGSLAWMSKSSDQGDLLLISEGELTVKIYLAHGLLRRHIRGEATMQGLHKAKERQDHTRVDFSHPSLNR